MFLHEKRAQAHVRGKTYPADVHYADSTVAIFVPKGFRAGDATNLVFYFHGWRNNVDDTMKQFKVAEQLAASGVNAVLVLAEGPKNSPDSFGGRLEETGVFAGLVGDVLATLKARGVVAATKPGSIVLAGHSGAYRVMAFILTRGGLTANVREVYLFDALYGQTEKFAHWIPLPRQADRHLHGGGHTKGVPHLMDDSARGTSFAAVPEAPSRRSSPGEPPVFIDSPLVHDDVVARTSSFGRSARRLAPRRASEEPRAPGHERRDERGHEDEDRLGVVESHEEVEGLGGDGGRRRVVPAAAFRRTPADERLHGLQLEGEDEEEEAHLQPEETVPQIEVRRFLESRESAHEARRDPQKGREAPGNVGAQECRADGRVPRGLPQLPEAQAAQIHAREADRQSENVERGPRRPQRDHFFAPAFLRISPISV